MRYKTGGIIWQVISTLAYTVVYTSNGTRAFAPDVRVAVPSVTYALAVCDLLKKGSLFVQAVADLCMLLALYVVCLPLCRRNVSVVTGLW